MSCSHKNQALSRWPTLQNYSQMICRLSCILLCRTAPAAIERSKSTLASLHSLSQHLWSPLLLLFFCFFLFLLISIYLLLLLACETILESINTLLTINLWAFGICCCCCCFCIVVFCIDIRAERSFWFGLRQARTPGSHVGITGILIINMRMTSDRHNNSSNNNYIVLAIWPFL